MQKMVSNQSQKKAAPKKSWLKFLPAALGVLIVIVAIVAAMLLKNYFHVDKADQKKQIQQVTIVTPPPPPPPPPKEEIKEPEVKEEIPEDKPEEAAPDNEAEAPAGEDLGVDADGTAGGDGFGLLAKKGGRGLLGGSGYEQTVRQEINEAILENSRLKHMEYVATINLKLSDSGEFEKFEIEMVSGDNEAKTLLEEVLRKKHRMLKPRPLEAASLVKLRIKSVL
jgi:periplasmic protein TonB